MILEKEKLPFMHMDNFKGGEGYVEANGFVNETGKIMFIRILPGSTVGLHTHEGSSEYIYGLTGKAKCIYDGVEEWITPGVVHFCPEGHSHTVIPETEFTAVAIVPELPKK